LNHKKPFIPYSTLFFAFLPGAYLYKNIKEGKNFVEIPYVHSTTSMKILDSIYPMVKAAYLEAFGSYIYAFNGFWAFAGLIGWVLRYILVKCQMD
jgi:hypothetical protein